jgi:hypothetical protein
MRCSVIALLGMMACAPDDKPRAELDDVCGEPSPFRLLELDDDRTVAFAGQLQVEQRRLIEVAYLDEDNHEDYPARSGQELWSVGECGETPTLLANDAHSWALLDVWPDIPLACRDESGEIIALDPTGHHPPNVVFRDTGCGGDITPWGLITSTPNDDAITASMLLLAYPDDPWTQTATATVLFDDLRVAPDPADVQPSNIWSTATFDDEIFAITLGDELIRFSLIDGTTTIEATGVRSFQISPDRKWIVWQDMTVTGENDIGWQEGQLFLRDRDRGTDSHLADTSLSFTIEPFSFVDDGIVRIYLGGFGTKPQRFFAIATGESFDLPPGHQSYTRLPDGDWLDQGFFGYGPFASFDRATFASEPLFEHEGWLSDLDDHLEILQGSAHAFLNDFDRVQGPLWSIDFEGERELLAHRAGPFYRRMADGAVLTRLDPNDRWLGDLVVVEPESLEEQLVDSHVATGAWVLDDGETMLYGVSDHERTGVWLARLAAD